jgi:hypothetical protein
MSRRPASVELPEGTVGSIQWEVLVCVQREEPPAMAIEGSNRSPMVEPEDQAAGAWNKLVGEHLDPARIHVLQEEHHEKALVCRLVGVGTAGSNVVAKRCDRETAATESVIYERVLPHLTVGTLRCYGGVADDDHHYYWLFLEDAGDEPYRLDLEEHRTLAGHWLGTMQGSAQRVPCIDGLATRAVSFYFDLLRMAHDSTVRVLDHPVLARCDPTPLTAIVRHIDKLQSQWRQVEGFCERMPRTLVHGDLGSQNARIRIGQASNSLLIMDWEKAGWGVPAIDLAQSVGTSVSPDITAYCLAVRPYWPDIEMRDVLRLAEYGTMFRLINSVVWVNQGFFTWVDAHKKWDSPEWYMSEVRCYEPALANWIAAQRLDG